MLFAHRYIEGVLVVRSKVFSNELFNVALESARVFLELDLDHLYHLMENLEFIAVCEGWDVPLFFEHFFVLGQFIDALGLIEENDSQN